jgi:hypothetical protein
MSNLLSLLACILLSVLIPKTDGVKALNVEYLEWKTLKINNQLPLLCNKADLISLLGKVDSIKTPHYEDVCASYFDTGYLYIYFGESKFETLGNKAVVSSIDIESGKIKLISPIITLDKSLTLEKIKLIFPSAVKNAQEMDVDKIGKVISIKVATSKKESDDAWLLFFRNGKLIRIDHWIPC